MKVTPEQIRAEHRELAFTAAECTVIADALEIADSCARCEIGCNIPQDHTGGNGKHWYDLQRARPEDQEWLPQTVRYLEARGLLKRDAEQPHIVSFNDAPDGR